MWVGVDRVAAMVWKQHGRGVGRCAREKIQARRCDANSTGRCGTNSGKALGLSSIE